MFEKGKIVTASILGCYYGRYLTQSYQEKKKSINVQIHYALEWIREPYFSYTTNNPFQNNYN